MRIQQLVCLEFRVECLGNAAAAHLHITFSIECSDILSVAAHDIAARQRTVTDVWYYGRTGTVDYEKAFRYFSMAGHNPVAEYKLADMYHNGYFVEKDDVKYKEIIQHYTIPRIIAVGCSCFLRLHVHFTMRCPFFRKHLKFSRDYAIMVVYFAKGAITLVTDDHL